MFGFFNNPFFTTTLIEFVFHVEIKKHDFKNGIA